MLAWNLGCTVAELEERLSGLEWAEWMVFMAEEGVLPVVGDVRHAEILAALHNGPLTKRDRNLWSAKDMMRKRWESKAPAAKRRGSKALIAAVRGEG